MLLKEQKKTWWLLVSQVWKLRNFELWKNISDPAQLTGVSPLCLPQATEANLVMGLLLTCFCIQPANHGLSCWDWNPISTLPYLPSFLWSVLPPGQPLSSSLSLCHFSRPACYLQIAEATHMAMSLTSFSSVHSFCPGHACEKNNCLCMAAGSLRLVHVYYKDWIEKVQSCVISRGTRSNHIFPEPIIFSPRQESDSLPGGLTISTAKYFFFHFT